MPQPPATTTRNASPRGKRHGSLWHELLEELPAAIFVAAAVLIIHHKTYLLDVLDTYTFALIGNAHALVQNGVLRDGVSTPGTPRKSVTVLSIDAGSYANQYRQLSPLNRCALQRDIERIYAARPAVLAIDLNLAPALWLAYPVAPTDRLPAGQCKHATADRQLTAQCQAQCQEELYEHIAQQQQQTPTVVMLQDASTAAPADYRTTRDRWTARMRSVGVRFGHPYLISSFGMLLNIDTQKDPATGLAPLIEETCLANRGGHACLDERGHFGPNIDSHNYLNGSVDFHTMADFSAAENVRRSIAGNVVFFGGDWDGADNHVTPVGKLPGVVIHAAAFASIKERHKVHEIFNLMGDVIIGLIFGQITVRLWRAYFVCRFSNDARERQLALGYVVLLAAVFIFLIVPFTFGLSYALMAAWTVWISPVPVAIGMFIDNFGAGSVSQATRVALGQMHRPLRHQHPLRWLTHPVTDIVNLWNKVDKAGRRGSYRGAAQLLLLWRTLWIIVVGYALYLVFH